MSVRGDPFGGMAGLVRRTVAMMVKEFIQLSRDRLTFAIMIVVPLTQLILFGYAINANPRHLPTVVFARDSSTYARSFLAAMRATDYFEFVGEAKSSAEVDRLMLSGKVQFAVEIPANFGLDLVRGRRPQILVVADAADPMSTASAVAALRAIEETALGRELTGPLARPRAQEPSFELIIHQRYNPASETSLNIVPGIVGTILTLTLIIFTALAVTRELERGTMENLLSLPIRPVEVMLGKIAPYILVGALQFAIILIAARLLFGVPIEGSLMLLIALTTLFIIANLSIGYTFSTIAQNQLQAMQLTMLFFLPSLLLSGFLYPFLGMPGWAQVLGEVFPLTHFLRIIRGIMLKGATLGDLLQEVLGLGLFTLAAMTVAVARFRQTLD